MCSMVTLTHQLHHLCMLVTPFGYTRAYRMPAKHLGFHCIDYFLSSDFLKRVFITLVSALSQFC